MGGEPMLELLIIADDFTGALDTGVQFAGEGAETRVVTDRNYDYCAVEAGIQVLFHKGAVNAPSSQLTEELSSKKNRTASDDRHNGGHSDDLCFIFLLSFSFFHFLTLLKKSVQYTH